MSEETHYLERELKELLGRGETVFDFIEDGCLDGMWYWDLERPDHEWMSPRFWEVLGYDPASKAHSPSEWQDIIHPDDLKLAAANLERHISDPSHPYDQMVRYRHREGHQVYIRCRGLAIRDDAGRAVRMLGAHTDLSAVEAQRRGLEDLNIQLLTSNRALEQFAFAASHDLREPLRTVGQFVERLETHLGGRDPKSDRYLGFIKGGMERMQTMVHGLLEVSTIGTQELSKETVDVAATAEEVLRDLTHHIDEAKVLVSVGSIPPVVGDRPLVAQLLSNLVRNGIKFRSSERPCEIEISGMEAEGDMVHIDVSDNGIGIPERFQSRIFELFQRLHSQDDYPGHGLGLSICQIVAGRLGGRIACHRSVEGQGTTMRVSLPRA